MFRRRRATLIVFALLASVIAANLAAQSAPPDLAVELRTATGSDVFQIGEVIPIEVTFSSTSPNRYLEPCELFSTRTFGYAQCRFFSIWTLDVSPTDGVWDFSKERAGPQSGPTFEVPSHDLTEQPSVFSYPLTNLFRFDKPGQYRIRFSAEIGLDDETTQLTASRGGFTRPAVKPHSVAITRELVLNIVPAGPVWEKSVIDRGVEAFSQIGARNTRESEYKKQEAARLALCTLGTPSALRAMARLFANGTPQYLHVCHDSQSDRPDCYEMRSPTVLQTCIYRARDTSAAIDEMHKLLVAPEVAVKLDFFNVLVGLLGKESDRQSGVLMLDSTIVDRTREELFAALPKKNAEAFLPSLITVLSSPPRARGSSVEFYQDLAFSSQIIGAIAEHFDELPKETQRFLLVQSWDSIRSPLMIPVLRRRAESVDGEALLRWLELDSQNATSFVRQEIVRPIPRFSSYYLRLPEASLPGEEQQLAENFLALASGHSTERQAEVNLARSASLLQRYATAKILPAILPAIDADLSNWHCPVQVPILAYLLKVSPKVAAPRVAQSLPTSDRSQCSNTFLTNIGMLQPSPVLERLALDQAGFGKSPLARNAAEYLRRFASKEAKPAVWSLLVRCIERWNASGAEERMSTAKFTAEDNDQLTLLSELTHTYVAAQAWVVSPAEAEAFRRLVGDKRNKAEACYFACGGQLSVASHLGVFAIYSSATNNTDRLEPPLDYLNPRERLHYSVSQYRSATMQALKDKLLQFPAGSEFDFAYDFTPRDRDEIVEISNFLREHGYKVANPRKWPFLGQESDARPGGMP